MPEPATRRDHTGGTGRHPGVVTVDAHARRDTPPAVMCPVCHARPADMVCVDPTDASGPAGHVSCTPCTASTCAGYASIVPAPDDPADDGPWSYGRRLADARARAADGWHGPDGYPIDPDDVSDAHAAADARVTATCAAAGYVPGTAPGPDHAGYIAAVAAAADAYVRDGGTRRTDAIRVGFGTVDGRPFGVTAHTGPTSGERAAVDAAMTHRAGRVGATR